MGAVVLSTISSAIIAVYVCFARDPEAFETAHPALYPILANAWNKIFPGSLRYNESIQVHRNTRQSGGNNKSPLQSSAVSQKIETKKVTFNVQPDRTVRGSYASPPDSLRGSAMSASSQQWSGSTGGHEDEDIEAAGMPEAKDGNETSVLGTLWSSSNSFIQLMTQRMGYDPVSTTESSHGSNVEMKNNAESVSQQQRRPAGGQVIWGPNGSLSGIMRDLSVDPFAQTSRMSSSQSSNNSYSERGRGQQMSGNAGENYNDDEDDEEVNAVV